MSEEELRWQADLFATIRCDGFRVAQVRRAADGDLVVDGWSAWERVEGRHEAGRWGEVLAVGERFHDAIVERPPPPFIAARADRWAIGDRVAWGELPLDEYVDVKHVARLAALRRPLDDVPRQVVHGDLTGNVLFADGLPPAVIDLAPYWRPRDFASAVVVADAMTWEGADESLLAAVAHVERIGQHLVRALIYRLVVDRLFRPGEAPRSDDRDPYLAPVKLACELASRE